MAAMLAGLSHPRWKVRRTCADFMDHFGDQRCVEHLLRALKDPKENVRRLALHSLSCQTCKTCPLNGDFVPPLAEMAQSDRSARARRIATATLGNYLHDSRAIAVLERLAEDVHDSVVAARARASLERRGAGV
jgi:HEAT repeat protein